MFDTNLKNLVETRNNITHQINILQAETEHINSQIELISMYIRKTVYLRIKKLVLVYDHKNHTDVEWHLPLDIIANGATAIAEQLISNILRQYNNPTKDSSVNLGNQQVRFVRNCPEEFLDNVLTTIEQVFKSVNIPLKILDHTVVDGTIKLSFTLKPIPPKLPE